MKTLYLFLLITVLSSCTEEKPDLDAVAKSIKEHYRGDVAVTLQKENGRQGYLLLELTDSIENTNSNSTPQMADRFVKTAFYSLRDQQRQRIDTIKITFRYRTEPYFKTQVAMRDLLHYDSARQMQCNDLLPNILVSKGLPVYLGEITAAEFQRLAPNPSNEPEQFSANQHNEILEDEFLLTFKHHFIPEDSCYSFTTTNGQPIKFCRKTDPQDDHTFQHYNLIAYVDGFYIFQVLRYEDELFVVFDPATGFAHSTSGYPKFSHTKKYMYSVTNAHGEEIIDITRLTDDQQLVLSFDNWKIDQHYLINEEGLRFRMISNLCNTGSRYVDCHFAN